ncbi:MAG: T9SS type A sorting domain-containing protein [Chitinispirillales bacterium]|nr:T9SS type A sorting domain-containing protein [Chitinispirillales bacterium]
MMYEQAHVPYLRRRDADDFLRLRQGHLTPTRWAAPIVKYMTPLRGLGCVTLTAAGILAGDFLTLAKGLCMTRSENRFLSSIAAAVITVSAFANRQLMTVRGRTLSVNAPADSKMKIRVVDMRGKTAARFDTTRTMGSARLSLAKLPAGRYFVEIRGAGVKNTVPTVLR